MVKDDYSLDNDFARQIYDDLHSNTITLAKARSVYQEYFGISHDALAIGEKLHYLLEDHLFDHDGVVPLPLSLALALHLREGMGRKSGPISGPSADDLSALLTARSMAAEYRRQLKCKKGESYDRAARAITEMGVYVNCLEDNVLVPKWHGRTNLSVEEIVKRLQYPSRYGLRKYFDDNKYSALSAHIPKK